MTDTDLEILETYLDGETPAAEQTGLRARIAREPALRGEFDRLSAERALRQSLFAGYEAGADDLAERILARCGEEDEKRQRRYAWIAHAMRFTGAAAACLAVGFLAGWLGRSRPATSPSPARAAAQLAYDVAVIDEAGQVMGVQKFTSYEEAQEFREDLRRWQQRQEQLRSGQVTVRSAQF